MNSIILAVVVLAADPSLVLSLSSDEILQCDHVVVKSVLTNHSLESVTIDKRYSVLGQLIAIEVKSQGRWDRVGLISEQFGVPVLMPTPDPILESGASYTEYDAIMFSGSKLVFVEPGAYLLRSVARLFG